MTRKIFYSAVLASSMVLSGLSAAHAGNLVFEAEEEQEIVIVEEEPTGSSNASASSQSTLEASDEKAGKPARRSKAKRSPR